MGVMELARIQDERPRDVGADGRQPGRREFRTVSSVAFAQKSTFVGSMADPKPRSYDEIPAIIRAELNADSDRDVLVRMRHLARKKRMRQPDIADEEMADYLALAENCENFEQWLSFRRGTAERGPSRSFIAWALGTLAILGVLTIGLIVAIALSVSGPVTGG
jgi:hypothetical protein